MTIARGAKWLINRMKALGYSPNEEGVCFGLSQIAMQAFLLNELDLFIDRLKHINSISLEKFQAEIVNARNTRVDIFAKVKSDLINQKKKELNKDDLSSEEINELYPLVEKKVELELTSQEGILKNLDISPFFEEILLLHEVYQFPHLFETGKVPTIQNALAAFDILKPQKLEEQGGVKILESFTGCYTSTDLKKYFQMIREMAEKAEFPISFILTSSNHTIHVGYDRNKNQWALVNARQLNTIYIPDDEISDKVTKAFSINDETINDATIFKSEIMVTTQNYEKALDLFSTIKENPDWKNIHEITSEKINLQDSFGSSLLYIAAKNGDIELVTDILNKGADINITRIDGTTALHVAAAKGHANIVEFLLEKNADIKADIEEGSTPLHVAVTHENLNVVRTLLEHEDPSINTKITGGYTPLHLAVTVGNIDIITVLSTDKRIDINAGDIKNNTPLHFAASTGNVSAIKVLLENGADVNRHNMYGIPPIYIAAGKDDIKTIKVLLDNGADINSPLFIAAARGDINIIKFLLDNGANVNATNNDGNTPINVAAAKGHVNIVSALLEKGANIDANNSSSFSPLYIAALNFNLNVIKLLVNKGADINKELFNAIERKAPYDVVELLLENGADISATLFAAVDKGSSNVTNTLLRKVTNINLTNINGDSLLHIAATKGHVNIVNDLLEKGANINAMNSNGFSPLYVAAQNSHAEIIKILIDNGADINAELFIAIEKGDVNVIETLLNNGGKVNARNIDGLSPIYIAAQNSHAEIIKCLVDKGADIDAELCAAVNKGATNIAKTLLENGADINAANTQGQKALDIAKQNNNNDIVKVFYRQMLINYRKKRETEVEYKTSIKFFDKAVLTFGYSKQQKIEAVNTLINVLEGSKSIDDLRDYEEILNNGSLKFIYVKIKEDLKLDSNFSNRNNKYS